MYRAELLPQTAPWRVARALVESSLPCTVRTCRTREDYVAAFTLIQRRYHAIGLVLDSDVSMRIMPYHLSPASQVFVAERGSEVVGTITLIQDSDDGLPMDGGYPDSIQRLRQTGKRVGEIASLAIAPTQSSPAEVFVRITKLLTFFARKQDLQYLAAIVHPRHAKFYRHAMGCQSIGEEREIETVGGNPGIPMYGNINDPSRYHTRWRDDYFVGDYLAQELLPVPMSETDCEYFYARANAVEFER